MIARETAAMSRAILAAAALPLIVFLTMLMTDFVAGWAGWRLARAGAARIPVFVGGKANAIAPAGIQLSHGCIVCRSKAGAGEPWDDEHR
jgi:hypothetical protein